MYTGVYTVVYTGCTHRVSGVHPHVHPRGCARGCARTCARAHVRAREGVYTPSVVDMLLWTCINIGLWRAKSGCGLLVTDVQDLGVLTGSCECVHIVYLGVHPHVRTWVRTWVRGCAGARVRVCASWVCMHHPWLTCCCGPVSTLASGGPNQVAGSL